jgi:hypothetical protein
MTYLAETTPPRIPVANKPPPIAPENSVFVLLPITAIRLGDSVPSSNPGAVYDAHASAIIISATMDISVRLLPPQNGPR